MSSSALLFVNYEFKVLGFLALAVAYVLLRQRKVRLSLPHVAIAAAIALVGAVLVVPLATGDPDVTPYLTIAATIVVALLLASVLSLERFADVYLVVLVVLSAISLVFFSVATILPSVVNVFPLVPGEHVDYRDALVHVFLVSRDAGSEGVILPRNSSVAWEPGAFQVLVNLALLFLLHRVRARGTRPSDVFSLVVLLLAVLSTSSFAGLFVSAVLLACYLGEFVSVVTRGRVVTVLAVSLGAIAAFRILEEASDVFGTSRYDDLTSISSRISLDMLDVLGDAPNLVTGSSFTWFAQTQGEMWNSLLHTTITLGVVFTLVLILVYVNFCRLFGYRGIAVAALLIVSFSAESYTWRVLFLFVAFAGLVSGDSFRRANVPLDLASDDRVDDVRSTQDHVLGAGGSTR